MTIKNIEKYVEKSLPILKTAFILFIIFFLTKLWFRGNKEDKENCIIESKLEFNGVINEYNGRNFKSSPIIFVLNDSTYSIPQSNLSMTLYVGDTIKKIKGQHTYYIKRCTLSSNIVGKHYDTINFVCP